jgi:arylsulfatase A-like enzyme
MLASIRVSFTPNFLAVCLLGTLAAMSVAQEKSQPNILWITSEDNGPQLGCYGDSYSTSPNIDRLASKSMRFTQCWSNAPVCAPARTTIITGMWPTSLGAQHMRSEVRLPDNIQLFPQLLRAAGYYCTNNAKEDYNVIKPGKIWDESSNKAHWRNRKNKQPFFAVFNFQTTHESQIRTRPHQAKHDASQVFVPPYHPDLPDVRRDWAQYYDKIEQMDQQVGSVLKQLEEDGLADDTIIVYFGDHGSGMPRGKRWLYQSGLHVPLLVHVPAKYQSLTQGLEREGSTIDELVGFIDLAPTMLSLAGIPIPKTMQGRAILGEQRSAEPEYMVAFRDRMDERYDCSRAIRDQHFLYVRNWIPYRPQGQYLEYMFQTPTTIAWKRAFEEGKLNEVQSFFWKPKPTEELYDLSKDPYQTVNLASEEDHQSTLETMRNRLRDWTISTRDLGLMHESVFHRLSTGKAPRELGLDTNAYPLEEIFETADLAVRRAQAQEELEPLLSHADSRIRYWGLQGSLTLAVRGTPVSMTSVIPLLQDEDLANGALAGEIVGRFGSSEQRQQAIERLLEIASAKPGDFFARLQALLALDFVEANANELNSSLDAISPSAGALPGRYSPYVERTIVRLKSKNSGS